jgi:predicted transcriptional regulator
MKKLPAGELENLVLEVVWAASDPVTPREVHRVISVKRDLAYTTVMTILVRLWRKGVLEREPAGKAFTYSPLVSREERAATRMGELLSSSGDRAVALAHFVQSLPADQVDNLRRALRRSRTDP